MRRLETTPRAQGIENGLAARIHDPLWLLARQWQFAEFKAEDAASPAFVDLRAEVHGLDRWRPAGDADWSAYAPASEPLEKVVEQERATAADPRLRLEGGLRLKRLLDAAGLTGLLRLFITACPFPVARPAASPEAGSAARAGDLPVPPGAGTLEAAVRRGVPDGARLAVVLARLAQPATVAAEADALGVPPEMREPLAGISAAWVSWWAARAPAVPATGVPGRNGSDVPGKPAAWDEHRLEYAFDLGSSTLPGTVLTAVSYPGGRLDWWAVDAAGDDGPASGTEPALLPVRGVPAPARFGGMPAPRFWEMEDARFDPGSIDAAPNDLGRLLLTTYATVYGNDWFVLPVRLPVASLTRIVGFEVTDVFGRTFESGPAGDADDGWNLFGLTDTAESRTVSGEQRTSPWFFLAPAIPDALESQPVETVLMLRDEMANLAWAVEAFVSDDAGGILDRFGSSTMHRPAAGLASGGIGRYRVDTVVPDHWFPLAPEPLDDRESVVLRLVPLARRVGGEVTTPFPLGALLGDARPEQGTGVWFHEEEVPRAGAVVVRTNEHARWHDGSVHTWTGRRKTTGGGEGSSGLRFDAVEPG